MDSKSRVFIVLSRVSTVQNKRIKVNSEKNLHHLGQKPTQRPYQGEDARLSLGRETAHAHHRGRGLAAILARAGFPPGPPTGVRCVPLPVASRGGNPRPGFCQVGSAGLPIAVMPCVQLPAKESALFKRVLVSGGPPDLCALSLPPSRALLLAASPSLPRGALPLTL